MRCSGDMFGRWGECFQICHDTRQAMQCYATSLHLAPYFPTLESWGRQHDLAEFVTHLMQHCQAMVVRGRWEARLKIGEQLQTFDGRSCEQIISLDVPDIGPWPLQDLIDAWDEQAHVHKLVFAPHWLALRLSRFQHNADGLVKVRTLMRWGAEVQMPCFSEDVQNCSRQVCC